jgi:aspartyl-tRNA(Asn)/glutamyl-tRNA(Gln) amidotransferase subunit B
MKEITPKFEEDPFVLDELIDQVIAENPKALLDYRGGVDSALDDLVREVVHRTGGKVEARNVRHMILKKL